MQYDDQVKQKNYSDVIKEFRDKTKINQSDLAKALGVRRPTISEWENGKTSAKDFLAGVRFAMLALQKGMALEDLVMMYPEPTSLAEEGAKYKAVKE
jgi:DNA-binding XRE family transcriptional regulator